MVMMFQRMMRRSTNVRRCRRGTIAGRARRCNRPPREEDSGRHCERKAYKETCARRWRHSQKRKRKTVGHLHVTTEISRWVTGVLLLPRLTNVTHGCAFLECIRFYPTTKNQAFFV